MRRSIGYLTPPKVRLIHDTLSCASYRCLVPQPWKDGLHARLNMRRILLRLMTTNLFDHLAQFQSLLFQARELLVYLRAHPSPVPDSQSPAHLAFDPYISRRLITFIPVRVLTLPPIDQTWNSLEKMIDGWHEMSLLSVSRNISTWEASVTHYSNVFRTYLSG